jgi:hypothetical protein
MKSWYKHVVSCFGGAPRNKPERNPDFSNLGPKTSTSEDVQCFGLNQNGQLGLGDRRSRGRFENEMGLELPAVQFGTDRHAVRLFNPGGSTMCALLNTAELKCWGDNQEYALGMGIAKNESSGGEPFKMGDDLI